MPRKIKFGSKQFKQLLINNMVEVGDINVCKRCGAPTAMGYICLHCGCESPNDHEIDYTDMLHEVLYEIVEDIK